VGWKNGVLVLAGTEISTNRGHLVAFGFRAPSTSFGQNAENAAMYVNRLNGSTVISHPYSKASWTWGEYTGYSGIEIVNADSLLKTRIHRWIPYLPSLLIRPKFFLLKILRYPENNMVKWDELNQKHQTYGYFSTDAHLLYKPALSFLKLHLPLDKPLSPEFEKAKEQVFEALKHGRFYNAIDAAAPADGFRFWCTTDHGQIPMGGNGFLDKSGTLHVHFPTAVSKEIHLLKNGNPILRVSDNVMEYPVEEPGTYRVEVYLKERSPMDKKIPWVLSNPIFLKETSQ
jgi:hypothetical protein